jgi:hypothetical protein
MKFRTVVMLSYILASVPALVQAEGQQTTSTREFVTSIQPRAERLLSQLARINRVAPAIQSEMADAFASELRDLALRISKTNATVDWSTLLLAKGIVGAYGSLNEGGVYPAAISLATVIRKSRSNTHVYLREFEYAVEDLASLRTAGKNRGLAPGELEKFEKLLHRKEESSRRLRVSEIADNQYARTKVDTLINLRTQKPTRLSRLRRWLHGLLPRFRATNRAPRPSRLLRQPRAATK